MVVDIASEIGVLIEGLGWGVQSWTIGVLVWELRFGPYGRIYCDASPCVDWPQAWPIPQRTR